MRTSLYLLDQDPERVAARQLEIKRAIAQRNLNRDRIAELQTIVDKLDRDSDDASDVHSVKACELQRELDELDVAHIDSVIAGKQPTSKSTARRTAILSELAELNTALETRCQANERSAQPYKRQIHELRLMVAKASSLEGELLELGGSTYRVQRAIDELAIQGAKSLLNEALRRQSVHAINYQNSRDWDDAHGRGSPSEESVISKCKLDDATKVVAHFQSRLDEALRASEQKRELAIAS